MKLKASNAKNPSSQIEGFFIDSVPIRHLFKKEEKNEADKRFSKDET
jgi:hypothetical protein